MCLYLCWHWLDQQEMNYEGDTLDCKEKSMADLVETSRVQVAKKYKEWHHPFPFKRGGPLAYVLRYITTTLAVGAKGLTEHGAFRVQLFNYLQYFSRIVFTPLTPPSWQTIQFPSPCNAGQNHPPSICNHYISNYFWPFNELREPMLTKKDTIRTLEHDSYGGLWYSEAQRAECAQCMSQAHQA